MPSYAPSGHVFFDIASRGRRPRLQCVGPLGRRTIHSEIGHLAL